MEDFIELLLQGIPESNLQLPDPSLIQEFKDLRNRVIWIDCEIKDGLLDIVSKIIEWNREDKAISPENRQPIKIFFNSPGGDLDIEETLVSMIRLSKTPVYGFALGMVASAASLIYLSCHKRFALPNAYFILHRGSCQNMGGNYNEIAAAMEDYKQQVEKMEKFYIENTLYTEEEVHKNIATDWYIRGDELLEKGIVNEWVEDISVMLQRQGQMDYTGYKILTLNDHDMGQFYSGNSNIELLENQYLIIENEQHEAVDYYRFAKEELKKLKFPLIGSEFTGDMKPRNPQQYCAMDLLKQKDIPLKLITGNFGSGKSMMCIVAALEAVQDEEFERIIFVRNNVQVKDTDQLGALPGDQYDKTLPYLAPFADHCGGFEGLQMLVDRGKLEVIPLAFLRGRSIRNSIIYSMESENLTKEHIQLIMGRVDEGSQLWMDGDIRQRDKAAFEKSKGLETMIERLQGNPLFGYVHLIKSERSKVAALADLLD